MLGRGGARRVHGRLPLIRITRLPSGADRAAPVVDDHPGHGHNLSEVLLQLIRVGDPQAN
jgi:hypothetical protein